jgi:tetratricopeptide (TPR) repeat protein
MPLSSRAKPLSSRAKRGICSFIALLSASAAFAQSDSAGARAAYEQGRAAMRERKTDAAVKAFERAIALKTGVSEYHLWLGYAYVRQLGEVNFIRKPSVGRKIGPQYDRAVELDSSSVDAAQARVDFYLEAPGIVGGSVDKAKAEAERLRALSPYRAAFARAKIAEKEKHWELVHREYSALIEIFPDSAVPHYNFGRASALSGNELSRGEAALRRFLALLGTTDPQSRAIAHYRLGMIREKLGDRAAARSEYDNAVALNPRYEDAIAARRRLGPP